MVEPSGSTGLGRGESDFRRVFDLWKWGRGIIDLRLSTRDTQGTTPQRSESPRTGPRHVHAEKAPQHKLLLRVREMNGADLSNMT